MLEKQQFFYIAQGVNNVIKKHQSGNIPIFLKHAFTPQLDSQGTVFRKYM